jgi:hypothetical protein
LNERRRQEVFKMDKTMADVLMERGASKARKKAAVQTRQRMLLRLLRIRFGIVPPEVVDAIRATRIIAHLDDWLDRFATAGTLDELEIRCGD